MVMTLSVQISLPIESMQIIPGISVPSSAVLPHIGVAIITEIALSYRRSTMVVSHPDQWTPPSGTGDTQEKSEGYYHLFSLS